MPICDFVRRTVLFTAISLAVVAVLLVGRVERPKVEVVVHVPELTVSADGDVTPKIVSHVYGFASEKVVPSSTGTKAHGTVSFGRGYGGLFSESTSAPFTELRVPAGTLVWTCVEEDVGEDPPCTPDLRFRTQAEAVIRPRATDCSFTCNAVSECVPAIAVAPGEASNLRELGERLKSEARASDGQPVFTLKCGADFTGGSGVATERARRRAAELAQAELAKRARADALVLSSTAQETVELRPILSNPEAVEARVTLSYAEFAHTEIRDAAIAALAAKLGDAYAVDARTVDVQSADAGGLVAHYRATAKTRLVPDVARLMAEAIAHRDAAGARRVLQATFGVVPVSLPDRPLPDSKRIRVVLKTT